MPLSVKAKWHAGRLNLRPV